MPHDIIDDREPYLADAVRAPSASPKLFIAAREETAAIAEKISKVEHEIDERVSTLYGL